MSGKKTRKFKGHGGRRNEIPSKTARTASHAGKTKSDKFDFVSLGCEIAIFVVESGALEAALKWYVKKRKH